MNIELMLDEIVIHGTYDVVDACEIASITKTIGELKSEIEIRDLSMLLIREVLVRGLMEIGDLVRIEPHLLDLQPWGLSVDEAMARVTREWLALGRNPSLGEICWLRNTPAGHARAALLP